MFYCKKTNNRTNHIHQKKLRMGYEDCDLPIPDLLSTICFYTLWKHSITSNWTIQCLIQFVESKLYFWKTNYFVYLQTAVWFSLARVNSVSYGLRECNGTQTINHLAKLAKWLSVYLRSKSMWVRVPLQSLKLPISHLFWVKSFLTFRQL